jgi:hypothetical protein
MTQQHPITPPPKLVLQWADEFYSAPIAQGDALLDLATRAAQYGADQELEACCEWLQHTYPDGTQVNALWSTRRPKPPSLKEQAMQVFLEAGYTLDGRMELEPEDIDIIHRALEQLND